MFHGVIVDEEIFGVGDEQAVECTQAASSERGSASIGRWLHAFPATTILSTVASGMDAFLVTAI